MKPSRERRLQLLADRAAKRWSRRLFARVDAMRSEDPASIAEHRELERQAERLARHLLELSPDPFAAMLRKAGEIEPPNPDDPDDDWRAKR